jgi:hypothetical protein
MKRTLIKASAATALVAGALFMTPTVANAYTPPPSGTVSSTTVGPGGSFTFGAPADVFEPGETVTISLTGENASGATLGFVKFAVETQALGTVTAGSNGGFGAVKITLPSNASGRYTVLATSASNPVGISASVTTSTSSGTDDDGLAATGLDSAALLPIWIGGGALVLAGGGLAVAATVRRNRKQDAA